MVKGHVLCVIITQSIRKSICDSPFMHKWVKGNFEMLLKFLSIFFNLHWGSVLKASLHWNFLQSLTFLSLFFSYYYHLFFFLFYLFIYLFIYLFVYFEIAPESLTGVFEQVNIGESVEMWEYGRIPSLINSLSDAEYEKTPL